MMKTKNEKQKENILINNSFSQFLFLTWLILSQYVQLTSQD